MTRLLKTNCPYFSLADQVLFSQFDNGPHLSDAHAAIALFSNTRSIVTDADTVRFYQYSVHTNISEPRHDKTNKVSVRPAKTQISLGIRPV